MFNLVIFCSIPIFHSIQESSAQFPDYQAYYQSPGLYQEQPDYPMMGYPTRRRHYKKPYGSSGGILPSIDYDYESDECSCSCNVCVDLQPCCRQVCVNCNQPVPPANLFLVPYPYPLLLHEPQTTTCSTESTTTKTTTTETTTKKTTTAQTTTAMLLRKYNDVPIDFDDIIAKTPSKNGESRYILTSLRKTKSNWLPKYGIVPIPDQLAESLMSQMRSMKEINNHRD